MPDIRRYEMLVRLKEFGATHAELFPETSGGGKLFSALDVLVDELQSHIVAQAASASDTKKGTSAKDTTRDQLRAKLLTLTRTARIVAEGTPGLEAAFTMPKTHGDLKLVAAARAIVQAATPLADQIGAHNLPTTILEEVTTAIDAFDAAIKSHAHARESRAAAGADIRTTVEKAIAIVEKLDLVVRKQCEDDAGVLAEWQIASHVSSVTIPYPTRKQPEPPVTPATTKAA